MYNEENSLLLIQYFCLLYWKTLTCPSAVLNSRSSALSSHLLPTNITGIDVRSAAYNRVMFNQKTFLLSPSTKPLTLNSLIRLHICRSSSKLCLELTEYTNIQACIFVIDNLCIAGNWWLPVVSVICSVHIFLLQLMTCVGVFKGVFNECSWKSILKEGNLPVGTYLLL